MAQSSLITRPTAAQASSVTEPDDVSSGGTTAAFQTFALGDATSSNDPSSLVSGEAAAGDSGEYISVTVANGVTANAVGNMAYWEWDLKDFEGSSLAELPSTELISALVQVLEGEELAAGLYIGVALTKGGMASVSKGVAGGIIGNTGAWYSGNAGVSWAAVSAAGANDPMARGARLQVLRDESTARVRVSATPMLADDEPSVYANTSSSLSSFANWHGDYDKIALLVGAASGGIASDADISVAVKLFAQKISQIPGVTRKAATTPTIRLPGDGAYNIAMIGHSFATGTVAGAYSGAIADDVANSWTVYDQGSTITNWPSGGPEQSIMAYLIDAVDAEAGNTGGTFIRQSTSGSKIGSTTVSDTDLAELVDDVTTAGVTPDLFLLWYGANDCNGTEAEAALVLPRMRRMIKLVRDMWPNCLIFLMGEEATSSYAHLSVAVAARDTLVGEFDEVYHVKASSYDKTDNLHPSDTGFGEFKDAVMTQLTVLAS